MITFFILPSSIIFIMQSNQRKAQNKKQRSFKRVSTHKIELAILKYTNIERRKRGELPLKLDRRLSDCARDHSMDMANRNYFSHVNRKKEQPWDRAKKYGYKWGIAENIGIMPDGPVSGIGNITPNADRIGKAHVKSWMKSPGHAANILRNYDRIGIGVSYRGKWTIATQDFADNPPSFLRQLLGMKPPVKRYAPGIFADQ
ncbi:uncharacterized protein YkwD [Methanohalophilus levihalophilus]|uniref:CAP domain-containing protein n=1 Tax=Methanohalophilus levihalophilus TaxID=1431282 RepID=UPI001AEA0E5F|nr:CAP domain-containing protein [Methanohalophilus levihalophilus]MBP2029379.1 uncharacterized protein YkwD [Methanohalophilus levihalophilus]